MVVICKIYYSTNQYQVLSHNAHFIAMFPREKAEEGKFKTAGCCYALNLKPIDQLLFGTGVGNNNLNEGFISQNWRMNLCLGSIE